MTTAAVIVAAGRGHRLGEDLPKQYLPFRGKALLWHTAKAFLEHAAVDMVQIVIHPDDETLYEQAIARLDLPPPCPGGATRQESVKHGLQRLAETGAPDKVLIHDGARPFVTAAQIGAVLDALEGADGVIPALPVTDTIKQVDQNQITATIDREPLRQAQTPQAFQFEQILDAHLSCTDTNITDDADIAERAGLRVVAIDGDPANIKVTSPADLTYLRLLEQAGTETRTGTGFDVHRLGDGDHVMLCGVAIPHTGSLKGHSDADVALHAITDAILGAIGAGDIGRHFPPSDDQWKGADSATFLEHAVKLVSDASGTITNLDLTIICEAPKITPHAAAMQTRVAEITGIAADRVSIKATTTEKLGTTGDGLGIAAQAIATVTLPTKGEDLP